MRRFLPVLVLLAACGEVGSDADPMVGDWVGTELTVDGDTTSLPTSDSLGTMALELSFTDTPAGLLTWVYGEPDGSETRDTYAFVVEVFEPGRWLVEIEDQSSDMILDCVATGDSLRCDGSCDGLDGCVIEASRAP